MRKLIVGIACVAALFLAGCDSTQPGPEKATAASAERAKALEVAKQERRALRLQAQRSAARIKAARAERKRRVVERRRRTTERRQRARKAARREAARRAAEEAARRAEEEARAKAEEEPASNCHPSYEGACLDPAMSDYDCAGGSGDGPAYTGPVTVVGYDEYDLDRDGDGYACE